jgi:O-acetyl-ADP-ribose deacetylase (regulator of RNase III)
VDGAIHRAAGPELLAACRQLNGCPTGEARMTAGFQLPARWVIHTVGPVWQGGVRGESRLLSACYENSFRLALAHQLNSIAFPAISTGVYGYPKREATEIALTVMHAYLDRFAEIIACCFNHADVELYQALCDDCQLE